jgi:hypothetical protein
MSASYACTRGWVDFIANEQSVAMIARALAAGTPPCWTERRERLAARGELPEFADTMRQVREFTLEAVMRATAPELNAAGIAADVMTLGGVQLDQHWVTGQRVMVGQVSTSNGDLSISLGVAGTPIPATVTRVPVGAGYGLRISVNRTGELAGGWRLFAQPYGTIPPFTLVAGLAGGTTTCDFNCAITNPAGVQIDPNAIIAFWNLEIVNHR